MTDTFADVRGVLAKLPQGPFEAKAARVFVRRHDQELGEVFVSVAECANNDWRKAIVSLCNHAPALLAALDDARATIEQQAAAVERAYRTGYSDGAEDALVERETPHRDTQNEGWSNFSAALTQEQPR